MISITKYSLKSESVSHYPWQAQHSHSQSESCCNVSLFSVACRLWYSWRRTGSLGLHSDVGLNTSVKACRSPLEASYLLITSFRNIKGTRHPAATVRIEAAPAGVIRGWTHTYVREGVHCLHIMILDLRFQENLTMFSLCYSYREHSDILTTAMIRVRCTNLTWYH